MRVLLVGGGGREHALGWKLATSPRVREVISLPGNPGLARVGPVVEGIDQATVGAVTAAAAALKVDLVVIGPEQPLAAGLADALASQKIPVWGPTRAAAMLESSKSFAKGVMDRAGVPTARWASFDDEQAALQYLRSRQGPLVVKADGLAAGKGVLVSEDAGQAAAWVSRCFAGGFGSAGNTVLIEDFLEGPEVSVFALCAGESVMSLAPARDYKRLLAGDQGPNTGGMGSYSPVPDLPAGLNDETVDRVILPILRTLASEGRPYRGFLYVGLVITKAGPQVLEFNCRLGDPETQVILPRLESDLVDLIEAGLAGDLSSAQIRWSTDAAVNVVLAADGYPEAPRSGDQITIGKMDHSILLFHAGTRQDGKNLLSSGGRVLNVVGRGQDLGKARAAAYDAVERIGFDGMQYRRDIAL
jgi:phosphoribosylamine---glycine ligase